MSETTEVVHAGRHMRKKCLVEIVPAPELTVELEATCHEGDPALPPTDVISTEQELIVKVRWCVRGDLRRHLCGDWCICIAWESCGPGPEDQWCQRVPFDQCQADDECYELEFRIPPGKLPAGECGSVYCLCVTLSSEVDCDGTKYAGLIFGFCKDVCCVLVRPA